MGLGAAQPLASMLGILRLQPCFLGRIEIVQGWRSSYPRLVKIVEQMLGQAPSQDGLPERMGDTGQHGQFDASRRALLSC